MPSQKRLLVVDDDRAMREMLASLFSELGHDVLEAASAEEALASLGEEEFDVVLSDIRIPGRSGIEMVADVKRLRPGTPVVLMTAFGSVDSAVEAIRAGAYDYITKPFEADAVQFSVERALEHRALEHENQTLRRAVPQSNGADPSDRSTSAFLRASAERQLTLREVEELYIEEILRRQNGNKVRSARILGIDRKTLYRRAERAARSDADSPETKKET